MDSLNNPWQRMTFFDQHVSVKVQKINWIKIELEILIMNQTMNKSCIEKMIKYRIFRASSWISWSKWALSRWAGADTLRSTPSAPSSPPPDTATTTNHWPRQSSAPHRPASTPPSSSRACDAALASKCGQPSEYPRSACSWWRRSCPAPCSHRSAPELSESKSDLRKKITSNQSINRPYTNTRWTIQQINQSINQSSVHEHSMNNPTNQSINQSSVHEHSMNNPTNQSINRKTLLTFISLPGRLHTTSVSNLPQMARNLRRNSHWSNL